MSRKKDTYWHNIARVSIEYGFKPAQVAKIVKSIFPQSEITGRHVGAYKRRLINDSMLTKDIPKTIDMQDAYSMVEGIISDDDRFVYQCVVGSAKSTLKCFEYKLTQEAKEPKEDVNEWLENIVA